MSYYISRQSTLSFDETVERVRESLSEQGFGILTEIDVRATLKEKLNVDHPPYIILGACNPPFAYKVLTVEPRIGVLLPCNVVVREEASGQVEIVAMDPEGAMAVVRRPGMEEIAQAVRERLEAALDTVG